MKKLINIKHWQLLALIFFPTIGVELLYPDTFNLLHMLSSIWCFAIYVLWLYSIGNKISKNLVSAVQIRIFRISFYYIIFYLIFLISFYNQKEIYFPYWQIPVHVLVLIASFYLIYFAARSLVGLEKVKRLKGSDTFSTFMALWFFPIGVFFLQPRVNKI